MPLGAGRIDWPRAIRLIKGSGYDGTITLEVFANERDYVLQSAEKVRRWWAEA
jgi:sugar phosphate isomerase/epimerase